MSSKRSSMHAGEAVVEALKEEGVERVYSVPGSPNFADIAKACNAEGIRVSDPRDVEAALRQGLAAPAQRPVLVEVMVRDHPYPKI